jgi:hypothetical protein
MCRSDDDDKPPRPKSQGRCPPAWEAKPFGDLKPKLGTRLSFSIIAALDATVT